MPESYRYEQQSLPNIKWSVTQRTKNNFCLILPLEQRNQLSRIFIIKKNFSGDFYQGCVFLFLHVFSVNLVCKEELNLIYLLTYTTDEKDTL